LPADAYTVRYAGALARDDGVDMRDEALRIRKLWLEKLLKRAGDRGGKPIARRS
jgi:hypothetical protein